MFQSQWAIDRAEFYGQTTTPTAWFDGLDVRVGAFASVTSQYLDYRDNYLLPRLVIDTDTSINMTAVSLGGNTYEVTAEVCMEATGTGRIVQLHMVDVLDHWPSTGDRNTFKQAAAFENISVQPSTCQDVVRVFTFDGDSAAHPENIRIIAWVQKGVASAVTKPADVYQSAVMHWPFPGPPVFGDLDGDGAVDLADYDILAACFAGPSVSVIPGNCSAEEFEAADLQDDGDVDLVDFSLFSTAYFD